MRKIIVGAMVSLDGVMQAPGGPSEDPTLGFKFGGWEMPSNDQAFGEEIEHVFKNFDLLLGRKTYEIFAAYWPYYDDSDADGGIAKHGEGRADGTSFGGTDQSGADPKAHGVPWVSTHTARWHTGGFFLIQDERASVGGTAFDTLSILGVEPGDKGHFARIFENHGFYRHYSI